MYIINVIHYLRIPFATNYSHIFWGISNINEYHCNLPSVTDLIIMIHMWILSWIFTVSFLSKCGFCEGIPDYEETVKSILLNEIDPVDQSEGVAWFNTTGFFTARGLPELPDVGAQWLNTFNYANMIASLGRIAEERNNVADLVYLYHKFVFGGAANATSLDFNSDLSKDILAWAHQPAPIDTFINGNDLLLDLSRNSSTELLAEFYLGLSNLMPTTDTFKDHL